MIAELISNDLSSLTADSVSILSLFFIAVIAIQSIKLMNNAACERERDFRYSPELKQARREFNSRQRSERDSNSVASFKPEGNKFRNKSRSSRVTDRTTFNAYSKTGK